MLQICTRAESVKYGDGQAALSLAVRQEDMNMASIVADVSIARSPEEVFSYVTDPARFSEWMDGVTYSRILGDEPPVIGSRLFMTRRVGTFEMTAASEITRFDPPRHWAMRGLDGPVRADVCIEVEPLNDGPDAHVTIRIGLRTHGMGNTIIPMATRQISREMPKNCQNLKRLLENGDGTLRSAKNLKSLLPNEWSLLLSRSAFSSGAGWAAGQVDRVVAGDDAQHRLPACCRRCAVREPAPILRGTPRTGKAGQLSG